MLLDIFRGPVQIVIGLLYGIFSGLLLWLIPTKSFVSFMQPACILNATDCSNHSPKAKNSKIRNLFFLLFGFGLFAVFGSRRAIIGGSNLAASGALAVLVLAFVSGQGWTQQEKVCKIIPAACTYHAYYYRLSGNRNTAIGWEDDSFQ